MTESEGFTLVKYKYPKRKKLDKKQNGNPSDSLTIPSPSHNGKLDLIVSNIKIYETELQGSAYFRELILSLSKILCETTGNSEKFPVKFQDFVCYGIGKISECPASRYQFVLLLSLWQYFKPSGKCFLYDPVFGYTDKEIIENFKLELIPNNEEAKRKISQKTLFFVPHCGKPLYNNILWANWGVGLENVIIFGNSFRSYQERLPSRQLQAEASYIARILPLTNEIQVQSLFQYNDVFNDLSLHYFLADKLNKQSVLFWENCNEPFYDDNETEIIFNVP